MMTFEDVTEANCLDCSIFRNCDFADMVLPGLINGSERQDSVAA